MSTKQPLDEHIAKAETNARNALSPGGIASIVGSILLLVFLIAQMSGGIKLLGDWRAGDKAATRAELLHEQQHGQLTAISAYLRHLCQINRDAGDRTFDCTKL